MTNLVIGYLVKVIMSTIEEKGHPGRVRKGGGSISIALFVILMV